MLSYMLSCVTLKWRLSSLSICQVEKIGNMMTPPLELTVNYPHLSPRKNKVLYPTHVATSPQVWTHTGTTNTQNCGVSGYRFPLFYYLQVQCNTWKSINTHANVNPNKEALSDYLLVSVLSQAVDVLGSSGVTLFLWSLCTVFHPTCSPFKPLKTSKFWLSVQGCGFSQCASFNCSIREAKISQVNVTFRLWKPTFIKVGTVCQVNSQEWLSKCD